MLQDYRLLSDDQLELVEKQTLRTIVQALQQYSAEAKRLFDTTPAPTNSEVIVLAEDLTQYALEVAEVYPINQRFAGFIDYKRIRWQPTIYGVIPQALLVDAKASTENNRDTLQQSQLSMDADFPDRGGAGVRLRAMVPPHVDLLTMDGSILPAVSTSIFVHFYYSLPNAAAVTSGQFRDLKSIFVLCLPHARLKPKYNPDHLTTFFGQGKHSPARGEVPRVRVYFARLRRACPWRLQELHFQPGQQYAAPAWRDTDANGTETLSGFEYLSR
jgi:hypothetical protein